jgi:pimeloyl-ACP methyl ester carboxylesterase
LGFVLPAKAVNGWFREQHPAAEYLHERLPHSELHMLDSRHFVWEDAADEYAALVNAWWADGYKTCGKATSRMVQ